MQFDVASISPPADSQVELQPAATPTGADGCKVHDLARWANNPLASRTQQQLAVHLREALKARLPPYMIPSTVIALDEIPRTINGKIDKARLPAPSGRPDWAGGYQEPSSDEERLIAGIWEDLLDVRPVGRVDSFFELGGHSMLAVRMMSEIEKQTGTAIQLAALFQDPTVAHLAAILRNPHSAGIRSSLVPLRASDSGVPLFCIHPAGGTVFCYLDLARSLSEDRPVYGLQAYGIDGSHPPHETVEQMAAHYVAAINDRYPEGLLHIAGWSLGGNIAFEVARQFQQQGRAVGMLGLIDSGLLDDQTVLSEEDFLPLIMALFPGAETHFSLADLRRKSPAEQLHYFVDQAAQAGIVPDQQAEHGQHIFQVFQSNVKAVHQYRAQPIDAAISLIRPAQQSKTSDLFDDPVLGWNAVSKHVEIIEVPGDHAHMLQPPAVEALAAALESAMRSAGGT